jgi:type 1 glutamine amidotransferase
MSFPEPPEDDPRRRYLEDHLGSTKQGIVLLHHAILSYQTWPFWNAVSGTTDRRFTYFPEQELRCRVTGRRHPITEGIDQFTIVDESYAMAEPDGDNEVLITTDHANSLRSIAWIRTYRSSRVFCYQSGHDNRTWSDATFQRVLHRGILWAAQRLD